MKLSEYLRVRKTTKTGRKCSHANILSRREAEAIGIPYPLEAGWPKRYADLIVPEFLVMEYVDRPHKQPKNDLYDAALLFVLSVHKNGYESSYNEFADLEAAILNSARKG